MVSVEHQEITSHVTDLHFVNDAGVYDDESPEILGLLLKLLMTVAL